MESTVKQAKTSKSKMTANRKYDEKAYDRITWRVPKGRRDELNKTMEQIGYKNHLNGFITEAVQDKLNGVDRIEIKDLDAYARSAHISPEEYIKQAVQDKMQRQDKEFIESVTAE